MQFATDRAVAQMGDDRKDPALAVRPRRLKKKGKQRLAMSTPAIYLYI
jgi:hypothetical protein